MTTTELVTTAPSKDDLARDATRWSDHVRAVNIVDAASCQQTSLLLRSIKGVQQEIERWFAPHIKAAQDTKRKADEARKALVDEQDRMLAPLVAAEGAVKRALLAWEHDQEQRRQAEERRLQDEARRAAEEATLNAAAELEREAVDTGDASMLAEALDIIEQPVDVPAVHVKSTVPTVQGVVYRDNWKAHPGINLKQLAAAVASGAAPESFLVANMTAINQWARATKGGQSIPGIRVINDRQVASRA